MGELHLAARYATQILASMILVKVPIFVVSSVYSNESATSGAGFDRNPDESIMQFMQSLLSGAALRGRGRGLIGATRLCIKLYINPFK